MRYHVFLLDGERTISCPRCNGMTRRNGFSGIFKCLDCHTVYEQVQPNENPDTGKEESIASNEIVIIDLPVVGYSPEYPNDYILDAKGEKE